jgi:hypothetical protein
MLETEDQQLLPAVALLAVGVAIAAHAALRWESLQSPARAGLIGACVLAMALAWVSAAYTRLRFDGTTQVMHYERRYGLGLFVRSGSVAMCEISHAAVQSRTDSDGDRTHRVILHVAYQPFPVTAWYASEEGARQLCDTLRAWCQAYTRDARPAHNRPAAPHLRTLLADGSRGTV